MNKQLTVEQRYTIYAMLEISHQQKDIALAIGVHKSTISRELKRNCDKRSGEYYNNLACRKASDRKRCKHHAINSLKRCRNEFASYLKMVSAPNR